MYYKCTKNNLQYCIWRKNNMCTSDDVTICKYSLCIHRIYNQIKDGTVEEMADIIQDYIDNFMCWNDINACPPTVKEVKEWLREDA